MNRRTKALQFSKATMNKIADRDECCIFCKIGYRMDKIDSFQQQILSIAHYINKSQGGLGIEENGVLICQYHHHNLDNGCESLRSEMLGIIEEYLKGFYPGWKLENLKYKKYS
ncbi:hypothetical protein [Anaerosacchariphilus polymeriproducens]|uniref:HNH endonuclease n=1 Tax=Anaerosacchariphilus polymeriproducens TaxID=1812858 RepID=A0A371ATF6_9FIRM|nr:hypothetical protein [Anaerosacchariphilus polymeriproducens]RDU22866.1 hypothetical protein DWV06_12500 [Anaerosacchariphilus polymeriproducens]